MLQQTPLSLFSFGLDQLNQGLQQTFTSARPAPFTMFVAPLSGHIADIATLLYDQPSDTITINLVKIDKLPEGATANDACTQAMTALRTFAGLDPATGQVPDGMDSSALATAFSYSGTTVNNPPADYAATLDSSFRLSFNGFGGDGARFHCVAPLLGTGYTMAK